MRVLQVCAEIFPLLKTGGLADVAGALPPALMAQGADVRVLLPGFEAILRGLEDAVEVAPLGEEGARLMFGRLPSIGVQAYVIDAPSLYVRPGGPYADGAQRPYPDNHRRFSLLGKVAARLAAGLDAFWCAELVHAHDWHAGLAPAWLHALRVPVPSVYTVHNLAYQGGFSRLEFDELGLPAHFFDVNGVEFHGGLNFMKAGLYYADRLTTVSPTYARKIQTPEQGMGLDGLLRTRSAALSGILNGVDPAVWSPGVDRQIAFPYESRRMAPKARNKAVLQQEMGLDVHPDALLFVVVSRLTEQKGLHLVLQALPALLERGGQLMVLGSGDAGMEAAFVEQARQHPDAVAVRIGYDEALAHRVVAGGDVILVPSLFEPCGLTQLYGLAYGTLPLVRRVGGLADTVTDCSLEALHDGEATGFVFDDFSAVGLSAAIRRAYALHARKREWLVVQRRGMARRHDWSVAAAGYMALYRSLKP